MKNNKVVWKCSKFKVKLVRKIMNVERCCYKCQSMYMVVRNDNGKGFSTIE